jgi:hypothetical protein
MNCLTLKSNPPPRTRYTRSQNVHGALTPARDHLTIAGSLKRPDRLLPTAAVLSVPAYPSAVFVVPSTSWVKLASSALPGNSRNPSPDRVGRPLPPRTPTAGRRRRSRAQAVLAQGTNRGAAVYSSPGPGLLGGGSTTSSAPNPAIGPSIRKISIVRSGSTCAWLRNASTVRPVSASIISV